MKCCNKTGIKLDKFGNLFFVEKIEKKAIMKVKNEDIDKLLNLVDRPGDQIVHTNITCSEVYSNKTTKYISSLI